MEIPQDVLEDSVRTLSHEIMARRDIMFARHGHHAPTAGMVFIRGKDHLCRTYHPGVDDMHPSFMDRIEPNANSDTAVIFTTEPAMTDTFDLSRNELDGLLAEFGFAGYLCRHPLRFRARKSPAEEVNVPREDRAVALKGYWGSGFTPHDDRAYMQEAISLARALPHDHHPYVGCVIVRDGQVISHGTQMGIKVGRVYHLHAERMAILLAQEKGIDVRGATLYSTLEPCLPLGSDIASCSELICEAGIGEVVFGMQDAHRFHGRSVEYLRQHGVRAREIAADRPMWRQLRLLKGIQSSGKLKGYHGPLGRCA